MNVKNWISLIGLSILWGGSFYFIEKALLSFSFEQVVFFRVFFAAIFIYIVLLIKKIKIQWQINLWISFLIMGLLNNVIPFLAITYAQESITASLASLFNATTPIFTAIFAHFLTKDEKSSWIQSSGILVGFIGMIILLSPKGFGSFEYASFFALIGAISYAFAGVFGKRLKDNNPLLNVFGMLASSSLVTYFLFNSSIHNISIDSIFTFTDIFLLAILSTALAYIIYFKLLLEIGAVKLLLVTFLIPISASILGIFLLDEEFTLYMLFGSFFIFISLYLINKRKKI